MSIGTSERVPGRYVFSTFCEDVRLELSGKQTHVGVFVGSRIEVHVPSPLILPRFCAVMHVVTPYDHMFSRLLYQLRWNGLVIQQAEPSTEWLEQARVQNEQHSAGFPPPTQTDVQALLTVEPLSITENGSLTAVVIVDGEEIEAQRLHFQFGAEATTQVAQ